MKTRSPKGDAADKAAGATRYVADIAVEGMLNARLVSSSRPRAKILGVEVPVLPDGYFYLDRNDIPGRNRIKIISDDWPVFAEETVSYIGEPIGLMAGEDPGILDGLVGATRVMYEDLPAVTDLDDALERYRRGDDNCFVEYRITKGDPPPVPDVSGPTHRGIYRTGAQEHVYLETQGMIGTFQDGRVTVFGSMQCPFYVKGALEQAMGLPPEMVRVVQTATGGGFGGKEDYPSPLAVYAAAASRKAGRPVRIILDRAEDMEVTPKRHPSRIEIDSTVTGGRITAMKVDITLDGGAYEGLSSVVLQRAVFNAAGVYDIPSVEVSGRVLRTHTVPAGAFRGFGAPQAVFAVEAHLDEIARSTGEDPVDFKLRHALREGSTTVTGGRISPPVLLPEMTERALAMSDYRRKRAVFAAGPAGRDGVCRGIGVSLFNHGCGFTGSGEKDKIKARVTLRRMDGGRVEILVSSVDFGQGPRVTLRKIAAEAMGIQAERVVYDNPDTDRVPDSGPTVASRTAMIVGRLVKEAAERLAAGGMGLDHATAQFRQPPGVVWDQETFAGDAYPVYSWGVNVVEVEVDRAAYEVKVTGIWAVYDVGTRLDETVVRGQMEGGIAQGIGLAAYEKLERKDGRLMQSSVTDYVIPGSMELPDMDIDFVENPYPEGPYGAKCAGELPFIGAPPAFAAAVAAALGRDVRKVPATPEYLEERR